MPKSVKVLRDFLFPAALHGMTSVIQLRRKMAEIGCRDEQTSANNYTLCKVNGYG